MTLTAKDVVRNVLQEHLPISLKLYHALRRRVMNRLRSSEEVFSQIHRENAWGDESSVSGGGSNLVESEAIRAVLPGLVRELGVRTFLDAPCGDFFWMRHVEMPGVHYVGVDVVAKLIEENRAKFASASRDFLHRDLTKDPLPPADLILCRDCLIHLSYGHAREVLRNFKSTRARYLLTTHFPDVAENHDIVTGSYRPINLERAPFDFPPPLRVLREGEVGSEIAARGRVLGLWELAKIPA